MASAPNASGMKFEVFLSFRGSDTRDNFTSCLYHYMIEKGIRVFKDDKELQVGEKIDELFKALDNSQIYIPIFSEDFASSSWCLREVARMVDRTLESDGKKEILPLFFDVTPEDVKSSTGLYSNALSKLEKEKVKYGHEEEKEKYDPDEVKRWRDALREVATRAGWKREGREYGELMGSIVREVQLKLKVKNRDLPDHLVKVDDEEVIEELLDVDSKGVRFVIIHGTGGIGKSTLAKVIFNKFLSKFSYSSFLEDVQSHRLLDMQKKLLSDTLGATSAYGIHDTNDGINRIRKGLSEKKVMVVVDNVNDKEQLKNLAGSYKWFGSESRIIITVRDKRTIPYRTMLDEDNQTGSSYCKYHQVEEMPLDKAIMLFSKQAFRSDTPPKDWHNFSKEVISSIGRLPLTLEVVGSLFANTGRSEWHETLKDLKQIPCEEVRKTLMISLNKLDLQKREIFLDIACFCIGEDKMHAYYMWDDCGYSPRSAIDDLLLMSLIKIDYNNKFWMHDEIRDLGRYLVKEENFQDAGKRRWVWIDENTLDVLRSNEEKPAVRALSLGISHDFTPKELARFPNLRFLGGKRMNFVGNFKDLLPNLRWLSWRYCPSNIKATNLRPVNLVVLDLSCSDITHKWGGWEQIKMAKKLKVLDLENCFMLTKTPDFSNFGKLEKLILIGCMKLRTIDSSIGKLKVLRDLNFKGCVSLQGLPKEIGSLECLSEIFLFLIREQFKFSEMLGNLKSLTKFEMCWCSGISQLPQSIGKLTNLTHLILHKCETLHDLPDSLGELKSLVELDIRCSSISTLPDSIGSLKRLKVIRVASSRIQAIPCALGQVETLEVLDASCCRLMMDEIPWEMWSLTRLRTLDLCMTPISTLPAKISDFSSLQTLKFKIARGQLCALPELPSSLKSLEVAIGKCDVLPDLSSLVHLDHLDLCGPLITPWSENEVMLSIHRLPRGLSTLKLGWIPQLPDFADFQSLSVLTIEGCPVPHFPVLKSLERLKKLKIMSCRFLERTPNLSGLTRLEELELVNLHKLAEIPGLGELESLKFLHIGLCRKIKQLPNLSKLKNLRHLKLFGSSKIRVVEGMEELISLKIAEIRGCKSLERLPDLSAFTKLKTDWKPPKYEEDTVQSNMPELSPTFRRVVQKAPPGPSRTRSSPWSSLGKAFKRGHRRVRAGSGRVRPMDTGTTQIGDGTDRPSARRELQATK